MHRFARRKIPTESYAHAQLVTGLMEVCVDSVQSALNAAEGGMPVFGQLFACNGHPVAAHAMQL